MMLVEENRTYLMKKLKREIELNFPFKKEGVYFIEVCFDKERKIEKILKIFK